MIPEIRRFFSRLIAFFRAAKADSDLTREINAHLQLLEDQFIAQGLAPKEARYAAKRAFGGIGQTKEQQRDTRSFRWLAGWSMDLKLGVRMLGKTPGITIVAVVALSVGIGAGVSYLEFISGLIRPKLSFPGGERLVGLLNWNLAKADVEDRSLYEFAAWKARLTTVEELGAARQFEETLTAEDGRIHTATGSEISASAFRAVPIPPLHGRPLLDDDEKPGAEAVIVIGEDLWKTHFDSDTRVVGRTVRLGETIHTVAGVMPRGFGFPGTSSFWTPLRLNPATIKPGEGPRVRIFGRLVSGVGLGQAQAELETITRQMDQGLTDAAAGVRASVHPFVESFWVDFTRSRSPLNPVLLLLYSFNILFIALLGICAANVAQLVFARTATRESEITIRTALGASRGRIVMQLVAEALVLTSIAAVAGLAGAATGLRKLREMLSATSNQSLPFWWNDGLGIEAVVYSLLLVIIAALLIGGVPALKATGPRMNARLQEAGAAGATMHFGKLWTAVMVAQVAVTVILLLALASSGWEAYAQNRRAAEVAFLRNEYLFADIRFEEGVTAEHEKALRRELQRRLNEDPGVINATFADHLPGEDQGAEFRLEFPSTSEERGDALKVRTTPTGSNYFETFQQPLVTGRLFTATEIDEGRNVAIVDQTFARLVLGGRRAIGQLVRQSRIEGRDEPRPWLEIVGVVKDMTRAPNKTAADAVLYRPAASDGNLFVHSRGSDAAAKLRAAASATSARIRLSRLTTIAQHAENDAKMAGFFIKALGTIAAVTLMLAAAGIHSLISFTLASRTREIGIRTALGAAPLRIVRGILSPAFLKVGIGIVLGGIPGTALIHSTLDWSIGSRMTWAAIACVAAFIVAVAIISCVWPVRRALKIQPTEALRTT
jgi:putative ABC transport system permease protein